MRERLLAWIGAQGVERPRWVLGIALALGLASAACIPTLEIASSRFELIRSESSFVEARGARTDLIATVTAEDPAAGRVAADALAEGLARALPDARGVLHRVDPRVFEGRELLFLEPAELEAVVGASELDGLAAIVAAAREGLGAEDRGETLDALDDDAPAADPEAALAFLTELLREAERWQRDPRRDELSLGPRASAPPVDAAGYLTSADGATRYVVVTPAVATDRYDVVGPLVERARRVGAEVAAAHHVQVAFTGYPALAVDEIDAIRTGSVVTGAVSAVLVMALFALGFRSRGGVVVAGLPLGLGMLCAFGMIALTVGRLNLLTQAAAPVFAGLGIDFAVHLLAAYDAARRRGASHAAAIDASMRGAGKAILTGGLTTSGAFAALAVTEHEAFRELGLVAGGGLLVVLAVVLFVVPALLTIGERRGSRWLTIGHGAAPAWTRGAEGRITDLATRRPWITLGVTALATVGLALGIGRVRFEANVEALLPGDAESVVAAGRLRRDGAFSSEVLVTHAPDVAALRALEARLAERPTVGRVESLASFVPADPEASLAILRDAAPTPPPARVEPLGRGLRGLARDALAVADDVRGVAGDGSGPDAALRALAAAATELADGLDEGRARAFDAALSARLEPVRAAIPRARRGELRPLSIDELPEAVRDRLADDGDGLPLYVHPAGDVFEPGVLDAFVADVRAVAPDATGSPIDFAAFLAAMERSLETSAWLAVLIVTVLLGADLRHPRDVALALAPVTLGVLWLLGLLGWLGIPANLANLAALPLILGVGVDDGVHLIHQRRATGQAGPALASVLRALVLTTATTVAGFGALGLAAHRGMQSFALVMVLGASGCLVAATLALPALMRVLWPDEGQPSASK
ncbi:MAG: MMPL family transporter [Sandaracinaceae bacterium]|nr:MMPL family transporter [Sandaracinaceae bacterium]